MTITVTRHIDELDAFSEAEDFLERIYLESNNSQGLYEKRYNNLTNGKTPTDGGIISLWKNDKVIATAQVLRTNFNFSELICVEVSAFPN
jgi:hypothetical protein